MHEISFLQDSSKPQYHRKWQQASIVKTVLAYTCNVAKTFTTTTTTVIQVLQLYQITQLHHGLMMVGPSGSGKSTAWKVLLKALERLEGVEGVAHIIDPKAISKEDLYGVLDPNTREWTDGLFTHILRK